MAFEFKSRFADQLFFPTIHIHDGEVHETEHFDHMLYLQNPAWDKLVGSYAGPSRADPATGFVRSKAVASQYCRMQQSEGLLAPDALLHRRKVNGNLKNMDYVFDLNKHRPTQSFWQPGNTLFGTATLGIVSGLSWLIERRMQLSKRT